MGAQVDHSFEEIARFKASRADRNIDEFSVMLDPKYEPAALERLPAMTACESVVVWVLSEFHSDSHSDVLRHAACSFCGRPFLNALSPSRFASRRCRAVLKSSPMSPRPSRNTRKSYLLLMGFRSRLRLLAALLLMAFAPSARQNWMYDFIFPACSVPLK